MDSQNITTQMDDFESRLWAQTQQLYIIRTFYMPQMNPKKFHTLPVTDFLVNQKCQFFFIKSLFKRLFCPFEYKMSSPFRTSKQINSSKL